MIPRILFVDDDRNLLSSYRRQFQRLFKVVLAESGEEGLELVRNSDKPFWTVVSDYHMPGMDGLTFLRRVREVEPQAILLVITGRADLQTAIRAVNEGFVYRFLTKPVGAEQLLPILQNAFREYKLHKLLAAELEKAAGEHMTMAMCSNCKKVREPEAAPSIQAHWRPVELFLSQRFGVDLSHGLCPECVSTLYGASLDDDDLGS